MAFDFGEMFTTVVREIAPYAGTKRLPFAFDCRHSAVALEMEPGILRNALRRLLSTTIDLVDVGFLIFDATVKPTGRGTCALNVKAGGTGLLASDEKLEQAVRKLGLDSQRGNPPEAKPRLRRAYGRCPYTGAAIELASVRTQGVLLNFDVDNLGCEQRLPLHLVDAGGGRAWVINEDGVAAESQVRRLARMGWSATRLDSVEQGLRRLRARGEVQPRPAMVMVVESPALRPDDLPLLNALLPAATQRVFARTALDARSPGLPAGEGFEVLGHPLSPAELQSLTAEHCVRAMQQQIVRQALPV
jgi:hypothetical protein